MDRGGGPGGGGLDGVVAKGEGVEARLRGKGGEEGEGWHGGEVEAAGGAGRGVVVVGGEVAVAIGVGAGGGDVRGVKNVGVDEVELEAEGLEWGVLGMGRERSGAGGLHLF